MKNKLQILLVVGCIGGAFALPASGQQDSATSGQEAAQSSTSSESIQGISNAEKYDPDDRPLSGAEDLSLGTPESSKNVLNSSIRVEQRIDASPRTIGNGYNWIGNSDVFGTLSLNRAWKRNYLTVEYDGGEVFYASQYNQNMHTFNVSQLLTFGRWSLTLSDQVIYSPEAPFGLPGPQPATFNFLGLNLIYFPNQTVLSGYSPRVSNGSVGQLEYAVSRRTSLTATGSYSLLHYTATSAADNNQAGGTLGYSYALSPRDKIALTYGYQQLQFNYLSSKMDINTPSLSYAHQVLGRFSFQVEGGAQLTKSFGSFSAPHSGVSPYGRAMLNSAWRRTQFSLSASRSILSGAGLSVATNTTTAGLSATRNLSRRWTGTVNGGYAENSFIGLNEKFRSGYAGVSLQKSLGQHAGLSFLYNFQKQVGAELCNGAICGSPFLRHSVGIGLNWQFRPVVFH
jgi:hypothetical protein